MRLLAKPAVPLKKNLPQIVPPVCRWGPGFGGFIHDFRNFLVRGRGLGSSSGGAANGGLAAKTGAGVPGEAGGTGPGAAAERMAKAPGGRKAPPGGGKAAAGGENFAPSERISKTSNGPKAPPTGRKAATEGTAFAGDSATGKIKLTADARRWKRLNETRSAGSDNSPWHCPVARNTWHSKLAPVG